jgi:hypothetical protein
MFKARYLLIVFVLVLMFYGVKLKSLPVDFYRLSYILFFFVFLIVILKARFKLSRLYFPEWIVLFALFWLSLTHSLLVALYTESTDVMFLRMGLDYILTAFIVVPILYLLLEKLNGGREAEFDVIVVAVSVGVVQAVFMFLMLLLPSFQKMMFVLIDTGGAIERYDSVYRFRAVGLTGFASYSMAVCQSFISYLFPLLWLKRLSKLEFIVSLLAFMLVVGSAILSARTSYLFVGPLFLWFLLVLFTRSNALYRMRVFWALIAFFSVGGGLVFYLLFFSPDQFSVMSDWMFEAFLSIAKGEGGAIASVEATKSLFFIPDESTIIFGDGLYLVDGVYYKQTDIGFLRVLLYGGIFGSILFYLPFIYLFYLACKYTDRVFGRKFSVLIFFFVCLVFVVNIKGSIFFDGFGTLKFLFFYVFFIALYFRRAKLSCTSGYVQKRV